MPTVRVNVAKLLNRHLDEPFKTLLGGPDRHHQFAHAVALLTTPPQALPALRDDVLRGCDAYLAVDQLPLTWAADLLLDQRGRALPVPAHLRGEDAEFVAGACRAAEWVAREARRLGAAL